MSEVFAWSLEILLVAAVPCYIVLQLLVPAWVEPRYKLPALAPLLVMIPVGGHALYALANNSGLWMIVVTFTSPFALAYLVGLLAVRAVTGNRRRHRAPVDDPLTEPDLD